MDELTLKDIQDLLPWTIKYSKDFRNNPQPHKDFTHAVIHVQKALGKVSAMIDDMDHGKGARIDPSPYVADLVVCALRMANTAPRKFDLNKAVIERLEKKNGVKLIKPE